MKSLNHKLNLSGYRNQSIHKKNLKSQETNNKKNTNLKLEIKSICIFYSFLSFFFSCPTAPRRQGFLVFGSFQGCYMPIVV